MELILDISSKGNGKIEDLPGVLKEFMGESKGLMVVGSSLRGYMKEINKNLKDSTIINRVYPEDVTTYRVYFDTDGDSLKILYTTGEDHVDKVLWAYRK